MRIFPVFYLFTVVALLVPHQYIAQAATLNVEIEGSEKSELNLPLYRGRAYHGYPAHYQGVAIIPASGFTKGNIVYQEVLYSGVQLMYDAYSQEVIVNHPALLYPIALESSWVSRFEMAGSQFKRINDSQLEINALLAALVETPTVSLFKQYRRKLEKKVKQEELEYRLVDYSRFIVNYQARYFEIASKKDFYRMASAYKKQLKKYYKQEDLSFRKDPQETLRLLSLYLNQLQLNS